MTRALILAALLLLLPTLAHAQITGSVTAHETTVSAPYHEGDGQQIRVWDFAGNRYLVAAWTLDGVTAQSAEGYPVTLERDGDRLTWEVYVTPRRELAWVYVLVSPVYSGGPGLFALWPCATDICGEVRCAP